jgi:hypothetical protein
MTTVMVNKDNEAYLECYPGARTDGIRDYLNYVIKEDKFWKTGNVYGATIADQTKAKQKLNELLGGEITMEDILERPDKVQAFLNMLPENILVEIINDGGTDKENR